MTQEAPQTQTTTGNLKISTKSQSFHAIQQICIKSILCMVDKIIFNNSFIQKRCMETICITVRLLVFVVSFTCYEFSTLIIWYAERNIYVVQNNDGIPQHYNILSYRKQYYNHSLQHTFKHIFIFFSHRLKLISIFILVYWYCVSILVYWHCVFSVKGKLLLATLFTYHRTLKYSILSQQTINFSIQITFKSFIYFVYNALLNTDCTETVCSDTFMYLSHQLELESILLYWQCVLLTGNLLLALSMYCYVILSEHLVLFIYQITEANCSDMSTPITQVNVMRKCVEMDSETVMDSSAQIMEEIVHKSVMDSSVQIMDEIVTKSHTLIQNPSNMHHSLNEYFLARFYDVFIDIFSQIVQANVMRKCVGIESQTVDSIITQAVGKVVVITSKERKRAYANETQTQYKSHHNINVLMCFVLLLLMGSTGQSDYVNNSVDIIKTYHTIMETDIIYNININHGMVAHFCPRVFGQLLNADDVNIFDMNNMVKISRKTINNVHHLYNTYVNERTNDDIRNTNEKVMPFGQTASCNTVSQGTDNTHEIENEYVANANENYIAYNKYNIKLKLLFIPVIFLFGIGVLYLLTFIVLFHFIALLYNTFCGEQNPGNVSQLQQQKMHRSQSPDAKSLQTNQTNRKDYKLNKHPNMMKNINMYLNLNKLVRQRERHWRKDKLQQGKQQRRRYNNIHHNDNSNSFLDMDIASGVDRVDSSEQGDDVSDDSDTSGND